MYLIDTNVLVAQSSIETWNVCTRPQANNGLGLSATQARRLLRIYERVFTLLPDDPAVYPAWKSLVERFGVSGVQVHDARLVAFMQVYQASHILTFNGADFLRYSPAGIVVVDPISV